MKNRLHLFVVLCTIGISVWIGCSSATVVSVVITHPAQFYVGNYRRMYLADMKNITNVPNLADRMSYNLFNAMQASGRFEMIDKDVYGKFVGTNTGSVNDILVIGGTVTAFKPEEHVTRGEPYKVDENNNGVKSTSMHVDYKRIVHVFYSVQFKITRASDATIIATPEIVREMNDARTVRDQEPGRYDLDGIARQMETDIVADFMHRILPYSEMVKVDFYHESTMPELDNGISVASSGNWQGSIDIFSSATTKYASAKSQLLAKAFYDLGLAYEFNHNYADARTALSKAQTLDSGTDQYGKAWNECGVRESEWRLLQRQNQN